MPPDPEHCPRCGQAAPTVVRGLMTICVACGAPRSPLASVPVNVAGQPAKVGGRVARVLGWVVLAGSLAVAIVVGALLQAIFPLGVAGWIVGGVITTLGLLLGLTLVIGGHKLHLAGADRERRATLKAVSAIAGRRGGVVTVEEAARALGITAARADELLTDLARRGELRLEVEDSGQLLYFLDPPRARVRVAPERPRGRFDLERPIDPAGEVDLEEPADERARRTKRSSV